MAVALASCTKMEQEPGKGRTDESLKQLEISACGEDEKTQLSTGNTIVWKAGDAVSVFDGAGNRQFTTSKGGASVTLSGSASEADSYTVLYPYNSKASYAGGKFETTIPESQQAVAGSFDPKANISVGKTVSSQNGLSVTMKNALSVVKITVPSGAGNVTSVLFRANNGEALTGDATISYNGSDAPSVAVKGGQPWVKLIPADGSTYVSAGTYYVCVNPVTLKKGVTIVVNRSDKATAVKSSENSAEIARATLKDFGTVSTSFTSSPTTLYNYSRLTNFGHPYVVMTGKDFLNLKYLVSTSAAISPVVKFHNMILNYAQGQLDRRTDFCDKEDQIEYLPNETTNNTAMLAGARAMFGRVVSAAYVFRMTGNANYLNAAKYYVNKFCDYADWHSCNILVAAETTAAISIAYDWLYYYFSTSERTKIKNALTAKGLNVIQEDTSETNISQVGCAGSTLAALALYESDRSTMANKIKSCVDNNLKYGMGMYKPDGNTDEGYGYWDYGTSYEVLLVQSLLTAFNSTATSSATALEDAPGFKKTPEYMLFMADNVWPFRFSDGSVGKIRGKLPMWWFAARDNNVALVYNEIPQMSSTEYYRTEYMIPLYACYLSKYKELDLTASTAPTKKLWYGGGNNAVSFVHTQWSGGDDIYLAMKGGQACNNHAHMDAGSIALSMGGVRWIDEMPLTVTYSQMSSILKSTFGDDGHCESGDRSQTSHVWDLFVMNNLAHSTVSVMNNDGTTVTGRTHASDHNVKGLTSITQTFDTDGTRGARMDMGNALAGQVKAATRAAVVRNNSYVEIIDEITARDAAAAIVQIRFVTPQSPVISDSKTITMIGGKKAVNMTITATDGDGATVTPTLNIWPSTRPVEDNTARGEKAFPVLKGDIQETTYPTYSIVGCYLKIAAGKKVRIVTKVELSSTESSNYDMGHEAIAGGDDYKY